MFVVIYDNFTGRNPFFLVFVLKKNHTFKFDVMVKVQVLFTVAKPAWKFGHAMQIFPCL